MNRRNVVSALGALATAPFLSRTGAAQSMSMTPDGQKPSEAANQHMMETAKVGSLSLLISRNALTKVQAPKVVQFVKFEIAEQNTISDIIKGMTMPASEAKGQVVPPTDEEAMSHLSPMGQQMYQKLQGLNGKEFEKAYLQAEVEGHQKLLTIQENYLAIGHDREELDLAKLAKGMIEEHLKLLSDLRA